MSMDTYKRRAAAGLVLPFLLVGVTPSATPGASERYAEAWSINVAEVASATEIVCLLPPEILTVPVAASETLTVSVVPGETLTVDTIEPETLAVPVILPDILATPAIPGETLTC